MEKQLDEILDMTPQESQTPQDVDTSKGVIDNSAENTLLSIAQIVLFCGIFVTLICFLVLSIPNNNFDPVGFGITIGVLLSTFMSWAALKVFANISMTLKEINSKMK